MPEIVGEFVDRLITVEMRMKGVPRGIIHNLYDLVRKKVVRPLTLVAAEALIERVRPGDNVWIATGAGAPVFLPKGETDGPPGAIGLARAIDMGLEATPIFICTAEFADPIRKGAEAAGITIMDYETAKKRRHAGVILTVLSDETKTNTIKRAEQWLIDYPPSAMVSVEVKGLTKHGTLNYMSGKEVEAEAHLEAFFEVATGRNGILTIGVGDGGNEIGFGHYASEVELIHPHGEKIASTTVTDITVVGAISNWGAYGIEAMLAFLLKEPELIHSPDMERRVLEECARAGAGDGIYMMQAPMADGQPLEVHQSLLVILSQMVKNALKEVNFSLREGK